MNRPSRGERESAATMRYCGCLVLPTRVRRSFTAMGGEPSSASSNGCGTNRGRLAGEAGHPAARAATGEPGEIGEAATGRQAGHPPTTAALALLALAHAGHPEA